MGNPSGEKRIQGENNKDRLIKDIMENRDNSGKPKYRKCPKEEWKKPTKKRGNRRAFFHDYQAPGYYMITASTRLGSPPLSTISYPPLSPQNPSSNLNPSLAQDSYSRQNSPSNLNPSLAQNSHTRQDPSSSQNSSSGQEPSSLQQAYSSQNPESPQSPGNIRQSNLGAKTDNRREMIMPKHTELGERIAQEIKNIPLHHKEMRILRFVVMPEHIHFVLHVKERLTRKLGSELAGFFGACSKHRDSSDIPSYFDSNQTDEPSLLTSLFEPFHDRIIMDYEQLDKAIRYVEDNPRRRLIKQSNPNLFKRYLHLKIGDREYAAYGNIFLLKEINLLPVRIHRRWSEAEFRNYHDACVKAIDNDAVVISPFIHPAEKRIRDYAMSTGAPLIILQDTGFEERFTPKGERFRLCSEGLLLLLAPWPENSGKSNSGYREFHNMNDMAAAIATMPADTRTSILKI